jgi:hypothetical protein
MAKTRKPAKAKKSARERAAEAAFRRAAVARGDAVRASHGKLPAGATHELEGFDEAGTPIIKRRRFSIG